MQVYVKNVYVGQRTKSLPTTRTFYPTCYPNYSSWKMEHQTTVFRVNPWNTWGNALGKKAWQFNLNYLTSIPAFAWGMFEPKKELFKSKLWNPPKMDALKENGWYPLQIQEWVFHASCYDRLLSLNSFWLVQLDFFFFARGATEWVLGICVADNIGVIWFNEHPSFTFLLSLTSSALAKILQSCPRCSATDHRTNRNTLQHPLIRSLT